MKRLIKQDELFLQETKQKIAVSLTNKLLFNSK